MYLWGDSMKVSDRIIRVYVDDSIKKFVKKASSNERLSESAWVRSLIMREMALEKLRRDKRKEGK